MSFRAISLAVVAAAAIGGRVAAEDAAVKGFTHHVDIEVTGGQGGDAIAIEFYPGVRMDTEPAITDEAGKVAASKVYLNQNRGKLLMIFDGSSAGLKYTLHYGGTGTAQRSQKKWNPTPSVLLEVRSKPGGALGTWDSMLKLLASSNDRVQGAMFVPNIFQGYNPFGQSEEFLTIFRGELDLKEEGDYRVFTDSCDASFVFIDDKLAFSWGGMHDCSPGRYGQFGRDMTLTKGRHKVEYYHGYVGKIRGPNENVFPVMTLGWKKKKGKNPLVVPATAFVHTPIASVGSPVRNDGRPATAHFKWHQDELLIYETAQFNYQYTRFKFYNHSSGKAESVIWDFGDGVTSTKATDVWHVFTEAGPYRVRLMVKSGDKTDACEILVPVLTPMSNSTINDRDTVKNFANTIGTYQFDKLAGPVLGKCFELVDTLEEPLPMQRMAEVVKEKYSGGSLISRTAKILAKCYAINDPKKAVPLLQNLSEASDAPTALEAKIDLLELYLHKLRDFKEVQDLAESYILANPAKSVISLVARAKQGDLFLVQGNIKKAEEKYRQAQEIMLAGADPREVNVKQGAYAETLMSYISTGKFRAARDALIQWEADFPTSKITGDFILMSSRYWEEIGDSRRALDDMELLLKVNPLTPYLPQIEFRMANAYRKLGEKAKAKALYEKVVKLYPLNPVCTDARTALSTMR